MKRLFLISLIQFIISLSVSSQNDTIIFLNSIPKTQRIFKKTYSVEELKKSDSILTNIEDLKIIQFKCSSTCGIDWEMKTFGNHLSDELKTRIINCLMDSPRIYFFDIIAKNKSGDIVYLKTQILKIKP